MGSLIHCGCPARAAAFMTDGFDFGQMVVAGIRIHSGHIAERHGLIGMSVLVSPETKLPFRIRTLPPFLAGILQGP